MSFKATSFCFMFVFWESGLSRRSRPESTACARLFQAESFELLVVVQDSPTKGESHET